MGLLTVGVGVSLTPLPPLGTLFFQLVCLVQLRCEDFLSSLPGFCIVIFGSCFLEDCSFLMQRRSGSGRGEVMVGSWEEWRDGKLWSGYIVWEKNLFSMNNKKECLKVLLLGSLISRIKKVSE